MSSFLVDPELFMAVAADSDGDPDLPRGTHVRLLPSPALGFPLAPFALWPVDPHISALNLQTDVYWHDSTDRPTNPNIGNAGGDLHGWVLWTPPENGRLVGLQVVPAPPDLPIVARLLELSGARVLSQRSRPRYTLAGPVVRHVRLLGQGPIEQVLGYYVTPSQAFECIVGTQPDEAHILSLPTGPRPGYAAGRGQEPALRRVQDGAPLRFTPPDLPNGPFDPLTPGAELARVQALSPSVDERVRELLAGRVPPPAGPSPWVQPTRFEWPADPASDRPWQSGEVDPQDAALVQAMDPGLGRYLGLLGRFEPTPPPGDHPRVWIAAGAFAVDRGRSLAPRRTVGDVLPPPDDLEQRLLVRICDLFAGLKEVVSGLPARGLEGRVLVALAAAGPLPDLPPAPIVVREPARWLRNPDATSTRFRQAFLFEDAPLGSLMAIGRLEGEVWVSRHRFVDLPLGSVPPRRAISVLLGREAAARSGRLARGLASDEDIPADGAPWRYRLSLADLFGRFGAPAELDVPAPDRPGPPAPGVQALLHTSSDRPPGDDPASPGTLEVRVPVPNLVDLSAGGRPLSSIEVTFEGDVRTTPAAEGTTVTFTYDLPLLLPMERRNVQLSARFLDGAGVSSEPFTQALSIADPRSPRIVPTGLGIIWTSLPGPSDEVELKLAWPAQPNSRHRVYLADARGLGVPLVDPGPPEQARSRAEVAVDGANLARQAGGFDGRSAFRLLTDPPIEAGPDGRALLDARLPRTLSVVQFVRVVPLSATGVESDFTACGLVPVAVPSDRRPPAPHVTVTVLPDTGSALITIDAVGLDLVELQIQEPGLFQQPPADTARRPEFRLRRASAAVGDPIYAREIARGTLEPIQAGGKTHFRAAYTDALAGGLPPFVRIAYWAEVRMPPERRIPTAVVEVPPADGVAPIATRQAADAPRAFSLPSVAAPAMRLPRDAPALTMDMVQAHTAVSQAEAGRFVIVVDVAGAPQASVQAIGAYVLRIWLQGAQESTQLGTPTLAAGALSWTSPSMPFIADVPAVTLFVALVDPLGRSSPLLEVSAQPI
jgi:hypothetical protein